MNVNSQIICTKCNKSFLSAWHNSEKDRLCSECFYASNYAPQIRTYVAKPKKKVMIPETSKAGDPIKVPETTNASEIAKTPESITTQQKFNMSGSFKIPEPVKTPGTAKTVEASRKSETGSNKRGRRKGSRVGLTRNRRVNPFALQNQTNKGKGRRHIFKSKPVKTSTEVATTVTDDYIYYKGFFLAIGDIVSLTDIEGDIYYAQIRGFMTDPYNKKSAVITWLLPTQASPPPKSGFDPATYYLGPEEDFPRALECMKFVTRAPADYYKSLTPYPPAQSTECVENAHRDGFIWKTMNPIVYEDKSND